MSTWLQKSAGSRTERLRQLQAWNGREAPPNSYNTTAGYRTDNIASGAVIAADNGCCGAPTTPENAYYVVTGGTRAPAGFDISGAFTIEWYQTMTIDEPNRYPRVFSIGTFSSATFAVSLENGSFITWINGHINPPDPVTILYGDVSGIQVHFALVRDDSGTVTVYKDGYNQGQFINTDVIPDVSANLTIRNESTPSCIAQLYGDLPSFRWVNGTALYTENFTPPTMPLTDVSGTVLLINDFPTSGSGIFNGYTVTRYESVPYSECPVDD